MAEKKKEVKKEAIKEAKKKLKVKTEKKGLLKGLRKPKEVKPVIVVKPFESVNGLKEFEVILYPLITEKAVNAIEKLNSLTFVINGKANKADVKNAVEKMYKVKVDKVNVLRDRKTRKKAVVRINKAFRADEIATKLGVI
ncbi:MAG: 50S ribosomal protein L23 [archaeon]